MHQPGGSSTPVPPSLDSPGPPDIGATLRIACGGPPPATAGRLLPAREAMVATGSRRQEKYRSSLPFASRAALYLAIFVVGVDTYIVAAVLPLLSEALGTPIAQLGLLASAYALPNALLAPAFGPLSDRFGRRAAMILGALIFTGAALASMLAPGFGILLAARFVNGIGSAILFPAVLAYASDVSRPEERGQAMGRLLSAMPLSTVVGIPLGALAAAIFGWRGALGLVTLLAAACAALLYRLPTDRPTGAGSRWSDSYRIVLRDRGALKALVVTFVWLVSPVGLLVYMGEFFVQSFGIAAEWAGLIYMVIGAVGLIATRVGSLYIERLGKKRSVIIGIGAFTVAAFLLPFTTVSLPLALATFGLWASGSWFGLPAQQALVSEMATGATGTVLAFNSSALFLGGVVGPALMGWLLDRGGFDLASRVGAGIGLLAMALAFLLLDEPRHPRAA